MVSSESAKLYFAYGSNLNCEDWRRWCEEKRFSPDLIKFRSIGYLPDYDVCFSRLSHTRNGGALDITPRLGQIVPGVIFEVHGDGWNALDQKEGAPNCYHRISVIAIDDKGQEAVVETYQVPPGCRKPFVQPQAEYVKLVEEGLESFGLPTRTLKAAAENKSASWLVDSFFVYGTLLRGELRFPVFHQFGLQCALLAQTFGRLMDLGNTPGLIDMHSCDSRVQGDFIRVRNPDQAIRELDKIEGFRGFGRSGSLYRRTLCQADVGEGRIRDAWTYCLVDEQDQAAVIPSGDWREHHGGREAFLSELARIHSRGDERRMAGKIAASLPFSFNPDAEAVIRSLLPLKAALGDNRISERKLAQKSTIWSAIPNGSN